MTSKQDFLAAISKRLGHSSITKPTDPKIEGPPDFWRAQTLGQTDLVTRFAAEMEELGATASVYTTLDALLTGVKELLIKLNPPSLLSWQGAVMEKWQLETVLLQWDVLEWNRATFLQDVLHAKVGITAVDYAIATTGSLVVCTDTSKVRVASLVPDVHIALVRSDQIRTRMGEVLEDFAANEQVASSIHFITGPSRSSDIENDLSIGVHGPAALHVFVLDET